MFPMTSPAQHLTVTIQRPMREVYDFVGDPGNLSAWAPGLDSDATVRFVARNEFGVVDHEVELPDGTRFTVPLRVIPNGDGAEVVFTLFRLPGVSDDEYERDAEAVRADLRTLRQLLESDD